MADVRALLAAERQSRRINHPALTYTKSGALICNICQLNVKSESLWEGHLRSANHKRNAKTPQEAPSKSLKRRRDDDDEDQEQENHAPRPDADLDRRKMPKSRAVSLAERQAQVTFQENPEIIPALPPMPPPLAAESDPPAEIVEQMEEATPALKPALSSTPNNPAIDEDEWAAFERDMAPLADAPQPTAGAAPAAIDYSAATISAAPVSAAQLAEQQAEDKRKLAELSVEDEQEDERGRMEEEFEIMEDMEERVRKLKEMREKLRAGVGASDATMQAVEVEAPAPLEVAGSGEDMKKGEDSEDDDDDDSDPDDWYH